jgi:1-aminocyclopropane-1-carboxylate deaminase/D-cysteine desulfhydrase-like pyridoxal-dependent ACC family enzyme
LVTAFETLLREKYFEKGKKILLIHSGGLQGNRSVASDVLRF